MRLYFKCILLFYRVLCLFFEVDLMFDFFEEIGLCYVEVFLFQETVGRSQSSTLLEFRRRIVL